MTHNGFSFPSAGFLPQFFWLLICLFLLCLPLETVNSAPTHDTANSHHPLSLSVEEKQWLTDNPVIKVAFDANWAPVEYLGRDGQLQGVSREYLDKLAELLEVSFLPIRTASWQAALDKVRNRELDMFPSLRPTAERRQFVNFTDEYISMPVMIFARDNISYISDLKQLDNYRVAVIEGYAVHEFLTEQYPEIELVNSSSIESALRLLAKGDVDAFIGNIVTTTYYLKRLGLTQIKVVGETSYRYGQTMAVRSDWPILAGILDKALKAIPPAQHTAIQKRWMPVTFEYKADYSWLWKPSLIVALILAVFIYWNRRLAKEITARKYSELAFKAQRQKLDDVYRVSPNGLWDWDMRTNECFCSPAYFEMLGYSAEGFEVNDANTVWLDLVHPDDKAAIHAVHEECANSDEPFSKEYRLRCKNGRYKWVLDKGQVVERDHKGAPVRMIGAYVDIDASKQLEMALKSQRQRLDDIFKVTPSGIWDWDMTSDLCYCSPAYFEMLGYDGKGFEINDINTTWLDLMHPDDRAGVLKHYDKCASSSEPFSQEYRLRCQNGQYKWILDRGQVVARNEKGKPTRMVGAHVDIEAFKQLENELRDAKEGAEAASLAKSTFLANMSHELRTPLNAVLGFSDLMRQDNTVTDEQQESLRMINSNGQHLLDLINGVLDMSKIEAGHAVLAEETLDLHRLLDDVNYMMKGRAASKGLEFNFKLNPGVPQYVKIDGGKLKQILVNLLGNAIKFTEQGHVDLIIGAQHVDTKQWRLSFSVVDSGIGISREAQKVIFDSFIQAGSVTKNQSGTGLGLAISQQFAELMNGNLTVESELGLGATFRFEVAVSEVEKVLEADNTYREQQTIVSLAEGEPEWRVLIIEDELSNRVLLRSQLEKVGFSVREAFNGQEGIDTFLAWQPHLIWMDMRMPVMDGYEATRRIRELPGGRDVKILALTASAFQEEAADILAVGCDEVHYKPYLEQTVLAAMAEFLPLNYICKKEATAPSLQDTRQLENEFDESLRTLPEVLVSQMLEAARVGDISELQNLLGGLASKHQPISDKFKQYIEGFRLQPLIEILESATE